MRGGKFKEDLWGNAFTLKVVSPWNMLLGLVIEAGMILLDRHLYMEGCGLYKMVLASCSPETL